MFHYFRNIGFNVKVSDCLINTYGIDNETAAELVAQVHSKNITLLREKGATPKDVAAALVAATGGRSIDELWRPNR